ncbi:hypothetical protein LCGC14_2841410, partial [marine sediment metagenome]
ALAELVTEVIELLRTKISQRRIEVKVHPNLPVVYGDRVRLHEVVQNLVENAVKYIGEQSDPRIEIGTRTHDGQTVCFVRDNGIGIDPRYHEKIFGLFDQLDARAEGSGVGLALVKRIVEVHGGRIWVESEGEGKGTAFCFSLKAVDSSVAGVS